jgi:predicted peptidase
MKRSSGSELTTLLAVAGILIYFSTTAHPVKISHKKTKVTDTTKAKPIDPEHPDYTTVPLQDWEKKFTTFQFKAYKKDDHVLPYRIYQPEKLEKGKKYPLVLFMHGAGERELDNRKQLMRFNTVPFWEKYPCYVLAPQCPKYVTGKPEEGSTWVRTGFGDASHTMKDQPTWSMQMAIELLDKVMKDKHIDPSRIYITGLSMGGFATWEILQREGDKFAAAVPVCGGADLAYANKLTNIPIWVFHGDADPTVQVKRSRDMVAAITAAGGHPKYTEYPGVGHDAWTKTYSNMEVWDWLFSQVKK